VAQESGNGVAFMHHASDIVSSNLSLHDVLGELLKLAAKATQCDACLVYLLDPSTREVVLRASHLPHAAEIGRIRLSMGEGITGWVAEHRTVVALARDAAADSRFKAFQVLPEDSYQAFLSAPLISDGALTGVINIHHRYEHAHSEEEIALIGFIGKQMGGAIAKANLAAQSERASLRMKALAGLARTISEEKNLDQMLNAICGIMAQIFESPVCSILLLDESRREFIVGASRCSSPDYLQKIPLKAEGSVSGYVVTEAKPILIDDVAREKRYRFAELARTAGLASLLSVPMICREKAIGTLNLYTREAGGFTEDEISFVKVAAAQAAIATENSRLVSEMRDMKRALEDRSLVERAKGILQQKHALTEEQAYLRLRDESRRRHRPMRDLAEAIILAEAMESNQFFGG
jgi:GAF domain-containing protein